MQILHEMHLFSALYSLYALVCSLITNKFLKKLSSVVHGFDIETLFFPFSSVAINTSYMLNKLILSVFLILDSMMCMHQGFGKDHSGNCFLGCCVWEGF